MAPQRAATRPLDPSLATPVQAGPDPRRWRSLPVILTATFMALFDVFVVNVAAPSIQRDLGASTGGLELVLAGYSFTYAIGLVTGGRMGDLFGRRRLFVGGMAVFTLASLFCGLAPSIGVLVAGRLLQGVGAAAMVPQVLALITVGFAPAERARALSMFGATVGLGTVMGQVLGGALLQLDLLGLGWRPVFFVNVPVGVAAIAGALLLVPESRAARSEPLDPGGLLTLTGGLGALLAPLVLGRTEGWPLWTWLSLGAAAVLLPAFVLWERRLERGTGAPLVRLSLLRVPAMLTGLGVAAAFFCFFGSFLLVFTIFLQTGLHQSALEAGLTFAPLGAGFAASSLLGRRLAARYGGAVVTAGAVLSGAGLLAVAIEISALGLGTRAIDLLPALVVSGVGNGLVIPLLIGTVLAGVPADWSGAVAGVLSTTMQVAISLGIALMGLLFFPLASGAGMAAAAATSIYLDLALVVVAVALSLALPRPRPAVTRHLAGVPAARLTPAPASIGPEDEAAA